MSRHITDLEHLGAVRRDETDLITGHGRFVDDVSFAGSATAASSARRTPTP